MIGTLSPKAVARLKSNSRDENPKNMGFKSCFGPRAIQGLRNV
jgi:hypothetical protein